MKIQRISYSSRFTRSLKKLPSEIKPILRTREKIFLQDCFDPRLKTHKLSGVLKNFWSFSITYSHRVMFYFDEQDKVTFVDVGDHDIYQ